MTVQPITPTPKSALPQHEGRPVPWVTRWSGEVNQDRFSVSHTRDGIALNYPDGRENRDEYGVLWKREGLGRKGQPQYSELNTYRQRACMTRRKCQVCGSKIDERPIRWLMAKEQLDFMEDGSAVTMSPPTCSACIPLALELCPHLKANGHVILKVLEYEPLGVYGHAVFWDQEAEVVREIKGAVVSFEGPGIPLASIAGYQLVVKLTKFIVEEMSNDQTQ